MTDKRRYIIEQLKHNETILYPAAGERNRSPTATESYLLSRWLADVGQDQGEVAE